MHIVFKRQIFRRGKGASRRENSLDDGVVREVEEHGDASENARFLERTAEVIRDVILDAHRRKDDTELRVLVVGNLRLTDNLRGKLVVLHAGAAENRQLLPSDQGDQRVNGRNARADVVLWVHSRHGIDRRAVDIHALFRVDSAQSVNRRTHAAEDSALNFRRKVKLHRSALQACARVVQRDASGAFKDLNHGSAAFNGDDSAVTHAAVVKAYLDDFLIGRAVHVVQHDQRTVDLLDSDIFKNHCITSLPAL